MKNEANLKYLHKLWRRKLVKDNLIQEFYEVFEGQTITVDKGMYFFLDRGVDLTWDQFSYIIKYSKGLLVEDGEKMEKNRSYCRTID